MRLGAPLYSKYFDAQQWIEALRAKGYSAAYCPVEADADEATITSYRNAAREANIVIAEVGAWSNPISRDDTTRRAAIEKCQRQLELAERIGARCCVNIAGGRGEQWDGPHPDNLSRETFDLIVQSVREIIDAVQPKNTFYALETMPWIFPDSPDSYLNILRAIDRPQFAVHLDPVNMISSPSRYFNNGEFIRDCFVKLKPYIRTCHAKDITLSGKLTVHLDETLPGTGGLDYRVFLTELARLDADTPLMIEHLSSEEEYDAAARHIRNVAQEIGVNWA